MAKTPEIDLRENYGKNYIMNGDMRIAQRGTAFTSVASGVFVADRFSYQKIGAMVHNSSQDTDVPTLAQAGYLFQNSLRLNLTTPDTSIAAGDRTHLSQIIEGYNWASIAQKTFTLSFWVKATVTGTYCVSFRNSGADRSYVAEYTINTTNTWEYKTITVPASPSAGGWDYANGIGLRVDWIIACGTSFQGTAGSWQAANLLCTSNQVNGVNTGATDFKITGIQLNEGVQALSSFRNFSGGSIGDELAACQRYFELLPMRWRYTISSGTGEVQCYYKVTKRAIPTITSSTADSVSAENSGSGNGLESVRLSMTANTTNGIITADAEL
jgi:hypothetical protein